MKKIGNIVLGFGIASMLIFSTACAANKNNSANTSAGAEIKTMAGADLQGIEDDKKKKEESLVVDVRSPEEYAKGHVKFAINLPIDTFKDNIAKLDDWKDKSVILYCNSGKKSGEAAKILVENGFKDVTNADGVKQYEYKLVNYGNVRADELLAKKDEAFLVDLRDEKDYEAGHFANAINADEKDLSTLDDKLPEDKNALIMTYCYSGNRSAKAAEYIAGKGYTNVWNSLDGTKEVDMKFE